MIPYDEQQRLIQAAATLFPPAFALRAWPADTFRISVRDSYINDREDGGEIILYAQILRPDGNWYAFAKGTVRELAGQVLRPVKSGVK